MFDFASNKELNDLSAVPANFRPFYKEKEGGGHVLDVENPVVNGAVEALSGARTALDAARSEADAHKAKIVDLGPLGDYGKTVEEIKTGIEAKLTELRKGAKDGAKLEEELNRQRTEMTTEFEKQKQALETQAQTLQAQLETQMVDREVLAAAGDRAENPKLLLPFVRAQVKRVEADGQVAIRVLKENGDVRYSGTTGLPMTVSELVAEMQGSKEYAALFKSEARSGSGHLPGGGSPGGNGGTENMTSTQKISAGLAALKR